MSKKDQRGQFVEWYDGFVKKVGAKYAKPKDINDWLDKVDDSHKAIREMFGGERVEFVVKTQSYQGSAKFDDCRQYFDVIQRILPDYLRTYNMYSWNTYLYPTLENFGGMKTAKHIMGYAKKQKIAAHSQKELEKALSQLGEKWAAAKMVESDTIITLTTEPRGFMLVGNYGCDNGSCFAQHNFNFAKRYTFAIQPHTFVALVKKEKEDTEVNAENGKGNVAVRMLGFMSQEMKSFNTSNWYQIYDYSGKGNQIQAGTVCGALQEVTKRLTSIKEVNVDSNRANIAGGGLYGHTPSWSIFDAKLGETLEPQILTAKAEYL